MTAAFQMRTPAAGAPKVSWALAVAELGLRVHPLHAIRKGACSCGKNCGRSAGKHPILVGWQGKATTDAAEIASMWRDHPDANIGIATGEGSGCTVIDADGEEGRASLADLEHEHGPLPPTFTVRTGGGGEHRYFLHPETEGVQIANTVSKLGPKLDVRTCDLLIYLIDGATLRLPRAKSATRKYKNPHWLPVTFRLKEETGRRKTA